MNIFRLCDRVRETAYAIHVDHGTGYLEKVYENARAFRLTKLGSHVERRVALRVLDVDGTEIGEYFADLVVERILLVELKVAREFAPEHVAQLLHYLKAGRMRHGLLVNFGARKFQIKKLTYWHLACSRYLSIPAFRFFFVYLACYRVLLLWLNSGSASAPNMNSIWTYFVVDDARRTAFFNSPLALIFAPLVGAALALSFAPFGLWPFAILCPAYLLLAWQHLTPRRAAKFGFWFTGATYLAGTYWIYHSVHDIGHAPASLAIFLVFGLVAIMGGYCAALGYALARWVAIKSPWGALLVLPSAWVLLEWFRGWFLSGFPWLALGYSQTDTPLAAFAPIGGVYAISLLAAISAGAFVVLITGTLRARIAAGAAVVVIWGVSALLWHHNWTQATGAPVTAAIVQGAVPQDLKWTSDPQQTATLYESLTTPHFGKDILLWPESALPVLDFQAQSFFKSVSERAKASGSRLVSGLLRYDQKTDAYYNGMVAFDDETQWYYKRRLVPFGEFFPVPPFVRQWLKLMSLPYSDMTPGARRQPALQVKGTKIGATICYEDAYGVEQLDVLKDATLLINITNDAWFGDSTAAPQHLQISRMRVMEAQRPLLRAANDGISAIINANGDVVSTLPRFKPGVLAGSVQPRTGLTPYAHVGNWPVIVFATLVVLVFAHGAILRLFVRKPRATETDVAPRTAATSSSSHP